MGGTATTDPLNPEAKVTGTETVPAVPWNRFTGDTEAMVNGATGFRVTTVLAVKPPTVKL